MTAAPRTYRAVEDWLGRGWTVVVYHEENALYVLEKNLDEETARELAATYGRESKAMKKVTAPWFEE